MTPSADVGVAIGDRFQDGDGRHRHVWNVVEDRVHYFTKTPGSHWTPGHAFGDAPTTMQFRATCAVVDAGSAPGAGLRKVDRAAVLDGDF